MKKNTLLVFLLAFSFIGVSQNKKTDYVPGKVIIKFKKEIKLSKSYNLKTYSKSTAKTKIPVSVENFLKEHKVNTLKSLFEEDIFTKQKTTAKSKIITNNSFYIIDFDKTTDPKTLAEELNKDKNVEYAEPDYYFKALVEKPNDEKVNDQWYLETIQAFDAWEYGKGEGQIIAVLDTGVDTNHEDLKDKVLPGYDFINNDNDPMDDNLHGTHVAGILGASSDNSKGMAGVAPDAKILPIKVLQSNGYGALSTIIKGVEYAVQNGATVINMSLGTYVESLALKDVLSEAFAKAMIVAAAGNDSARIENEGVLVKPAYPACYNFVLGVEAVSNIKEEGFLKRASFSNLDPSGPIVYDNPKGFNYELKAPGVGILSTIPKNGYRNLNGTSMAAPMVAGAVALMKSYNESMTNDEIFARLIQSSNRNNGVLQTKSAIEYDLKPDLYFQNTVVVDTLKTKPGDGDFIVDAGERIGISLFVKNSGAKAEKVYVKLKLGEFEDPTVATIVKDSINLGNIGIYGKLGHTEIPLELDIASNLVHGRFIVLNYEIGATNTDQKVKGTFDIRVTNAEELVGILSDEKTLSADKLWVVNRSFRVSETGVLNLEAGTNLILEKPIINYGIIKGKGEQNKRIHIKGPSGINPNGSGGPRSVGTLDFEYADFSDFTSASEAQVISAEKGGFKYCRFLNSHYNLGPLISIDKPLIISNPAFENCVFKNIQSIGKTIIGGEFEVSKCNFDNFDASINLLPSIDNCNINRGINERFVIITGRHRDADSGVYYDGVLKNNNIIPFFKSNGTISSQLFKLKSNSSGNVEGNYWGHTDKEYIDKYIYDFWDDPTLPIANYTPLEKPSSEAHGIVWKVEINQVDILHTNFDPVGAERLKFQVYFNRTMNPEKVPFLTFGLREPRTQNQVLEEASWNIDNTVWTAYYTVDYRTGDGINFIRVSGAEDLEGFEIPVEDNLRFKFNIQTTGALSNNLNATPEIGKVKVDWQTIDEVDVLGNNIYRYESYIDENEEVQFTEKIKINEALILDGTYTDEGGDPNIDYYYQITSLDANFNESDFSSSVKASPLDNTASTSTYEVSSKILVYPNPSKDAIQIKTPLEIISSKIYDVRGNLVKQNNKSKTADISTLATGIYFLKIETEKGLGIKKIIKK